jgi:DNA-binding NarL/FixJ family response regulator
MKILLWCNDLTIRFKLEAKWKSHGAVMLKKTEADTPDLIVVDLAVRDALDQIKRLRALHPAADIVAFDAQFDADVFDAAQAAGAGDFAPRGSIAERITRRLSAAA